MIMMIIYALSSNNKRNYTEMVSIKFSYSIEYKLSQNYAHFIEL